MTTRRAQVCDLAFHQRFTADVAWSLLILLGFGCFCGFQGPAIAGRLWLELQYGLRCSDPALIPVAPGLHATLIHLALRVAAARGAQRVGWYDPTGQGWGVTTEAGNEWLCCIGSTPVKFSPNASVSFFLCVWRGFGCGRRRALVALQLPCSHNTTGASRCGFQCFVTTLSLLRRGRPPSRDGSPH